MDALFHEVAAAVALALEAIAVLLITCGSVHALARAASTIASSDLQSVDRSVYLRLGRWLLLALAFTLAADVVRTAISPSWHDIGQLAAIAVIRTFLNYFLDRDLDKLRPAGSGAP
jgi:uncharacterized membrane protein